KHAVERAVLMSDDLAIEVEDLALRTLAGGTLPLEELKLGEVERLLIERAMDRHDGNVSRAAERLGLSRSALYRRLARYRIGDVR
ncbi:MAG: helix-turn-helix domain-containing protein, partial [Gemmatimonadetes bacterium]|nr:helix-turn-helix domain-containing protein [Gemmatimonadota bacterium]